MSGHGGVTTGAATSPGPARLGRSRVRLARAVALLLALAAIFVAVSWGSDDPDAVAQPLPPDAVAVGDLWVYDGYLREPASPATAAAYFSVRNDGDETDELLSVTTAAAPVVSLHDLPGAPGHHAGGALPIEPGESVTLSPGHGHAMLENPVGPLEPGQRVSLVLTFAQAGSLRIDVPVIAIGSDPPGGRQ